MVDDATEQKETIRPDESNEDFRRIPDDIVFAKVDREKLTQMYLPIHTWMRLCDELNNCKTRFAPMWANAIWTLVGLLAPTVVTALSDIATQRASHQSLSITISMIFSFIFSFY